MEDRDNSQYRVVMNHEEQYSIWPFGREIPPGWNDQGVTGTKTQCLDHIEKVWTDMRPLSLRRAMENLKNEPPVEVAQPPAERPLVDRLSGNDHPVELVLRPARNSEYAEAAIKRGTVQIKFINTRGGTELSIPIDREKSVLDSADFRAGVGSLHIEGDLTLDLVRVRCRADLDLATFTGRGGLEKL